MLSTSVKPTEELFVLPPVFIPQHFEFHHYADALTAVPLARYLRNTFYLVVLNVLGTVLSSALVAYAFARYEVPGSKVALRPDLATLMLPHQVTMIPLFLIFKELGWINTFLPLWVPAFFGSPFAIFFLRQFFKTIPQDIFAAARIDGCSEFGQFWRIMLPLSRPALATIAIFSFQFTWNDFINPLIYINEQDKKTLALGLRDYYQMFTTTVEWQQMMAASAMMIIPMVVIFLFAQRYFIQGIAVTGLKG